MSAGFGTPSGVLVTADDRIWFDDGQLGIVGRLNPDGSVTVLASALRHPGAMAEADDGAIFVAEGESGRILRIVPGLSPFVVRSPPAAAAGVSGLVIDPKTGDLLAAVPGGVMRISPDGRRSASVADGLGPEPRLALEPAGSLLISDRSAGLQRVDSSGAVYRVPGLPRMHALVVDRLSRILFVSERNELWRWSPAGQTRLLTVVPPQAGLALDQADNVLVADPRANRLERMVTSFHVPQTQRLRVGQGDRVAFCLPVQRARGFTADVTLSLTAMPPGITARIVQQPTAQLGARLEITASSLARLNQGAIVLLAESGRLHQRVFLLLDFGG